MPITIYGIKPSDNDLFLIPFMEKHFKGNYEEVEGETLKTCEFNINKTTVTISEHLIINNPYRYILEIEGTKRGIRKSKINIEKKIGLPLERIG